MGTSLNWEDLKHFGLVASTLSIRGAAAISRMSAATLSRRIVNLEEKLGEALFIRRANRLTLTPLGKDVLSHVEQVRSQVRSIEKRCTLWPGRRKIRISTPASYARLSLLSLLREVSARFDNMTFIFESGTADPAQSDIVVSFDRPQEEGFSHRQLCEIGLRAYRARSSPKADGLILWPNTHEEFRFMNDRLRGFLPDAHEVVVMNCAESYVDTVAEGFGIGLICEQILRHHPRSAELDLLAQCATRTLWLSSRTDATPTAVIRQIEQRILELEAQ